MSSALWTVALTVALGQGPYGGYPDYAVGLGAGASPAAPVADGTVGEQLYPFDSYDAWVHGYFQEIPAYGGYHFYRPYNYKHVLSQSQVAGGWGMSPTMPYSQEYFRKYQNQAAVEHRLSRLDAAYAAEMARLRAQHDHQRTLAENGQRDPAGDLRPAASVAASAAAASRDVDPALYTAPRPSRIDEIQERIRQQTLQLQALQSSLQEEQDRASPPPPNPGYRDPAGMR